MIKGAIFDMDGTIIDSMFIWDTIAEDYLLSLGIEPKENLGETFKTFTLEQSAEYYRKNYGVTLTVSEIKDGINSMVEDIYRKKVTLKGQGISWKDLVLLVSKCVLLLLQTGILQIKCLVVLVWINTFLIYLYAVRWDLTKNLLKFTDMH